MKGMAEPTMLYRKGTRERLHGVRVDTIIVEARDVDDYLEDGWYRTPTDVKNASAEENSQQAALDRAKQEGIRLAREEEQLRLFDEAIQRAREEGAREERERIEAERAEREVADKSSEKAAPKKAATEKAAS